MGQGQRGTGDKKREKGGQESVKLQTQKSGGRREIKTGESVEIKSAPTKTRRKKLGKENPPSVEVERRTKRGSPGGGDWGGKVK